jgi:hypothetical protein
MFRKKEIFLWIVMTFVCIFMAWSFRLEAAEKRNLYPNVLMYNSTASCIQGVVSLLLVSNPNLRNQMLPPAVLQQLIGHCSCVMDKIRLLHSVEEYSANMHDYVWIRSIWGKYGAECVDMGYLAGLGIGRAPQPSDNQTTEEPKETKPIPKIKPVPEETLNDTSFQG